MRILAIETSCDETAIAIIEGLENKKSPQFLVHSNIVSSQMAIHTRWGGVVPNIAKREHQRLLPPMLNKVLKEAKVISNFPSSAKAPAGKQFSISKPFDFVQGAQVLSFKFQVLNSLLGREPELLKVFKKKILKLPIPDIDAIAVTQGPGLEPALWVGVNFARALSYIWKKPLIGINHMEGHVVSALLKQSGGVFKSQFPISKPFDFVQGAQVLSFKFQAIRYPAIALLVSGGHTELVLIKKPLMYEIVGETRDDAAGEAFDKVARMLELDYPGGPAIAAEANLGTGHPSSLGARGAKLPRPMIHSKDFDFSFSGLKTAVLYLVRDLEKQGIDVKKLRPAICREFQDAVVDVLVAKTIRAAHQYKVKTVLLGGGVAANKELRTRLCEKLKEELPEASCWLPDATLTGDNALMVAAAAYQQILHNKNLLAKNGKTHALWRDMKPEANMKLL